MQLFAVPVLSVYQVLMAIREAQLNCASGTVILICMSS